MGSDLIKSLKEFFFDIIGFLVPGIIVLVIVGYIVDKNIEIKSDKYVLLAVSYVIGYLIFALTLVKESLMNTIKCKHSNKNVIAELEKLDSFKVGKEMIILQLSVGKEKISNYKSFRNFAMSIVPESAEKIYLFMFRSELFNQLHTISLFTLFYFIYNLIASLIKNQVTTETILFTTLFILSSLTLRRGWERFYRISMNIPFVMYLAKNKNE